MQILTKSNLHLNNSNDSIADAMQLKQNVRRKMIHNTKKK